MDKLAAFLTHWLPLNREFGEAARYSALVGFDHDDSNMAVLHKVCTAFCFQENFQRGLLRHSDRQTNQFRATFCLRFAFSVSSVVICSVSNPTFFSRSSMTSLPRLAVDAILAISFAVSIALIPTANQSRQRLRLATHSRRSRLKFRILFSPPIRSRHFDSVF